MHIEGSAVLAQIRGASLAGAHALRRADSDLGQLSQAPSTPGMTFNFSISSLRKSRWESVVVANF